MEEFVNWKNDSLSRVKAQKDLLVKFMNTHAVQ